MKFLILPFIAVLLFSCNQNNSQEESKRFEKQFNRITETSPSNLCLLFLEQCNTADRSSPFSKYTPEMINRQCAAIYRIAAEDHAKLLAKILVFKKVVNTKNISIDQMKNSIDKVRARNNKDKIDKIALQSYDSLVKFKQQQLQFEIGSGF
jgi:hypothetical protein